MKHKIVKMINQLSTDDRLRLKSFPFMFFNYQLKKESEGDKWFIEITKQIPIPTKELKEKEEYDYK